MSVELSNYVATLTRQVTPLGGSLPAGVTNSQMIGYLVDAFWQARLDGLMVGFACDTQGSITPLHGGDPDLDQRYVAMIVLYAAITILSNQILQSAGGSTKFRAKAGPVEFEQETATSATVLAEMLKQLRLTKDQILEELDSLVGVTHTYYLDAYSVRALDYRSYWGSPELM